MTSLTIAKTTDRSGTLALQHSRSRNAAQAKQPARRPSMSSGAEIQELLADQPRKQLWHPLFERATGYVGLPHSRLDRLDARLGGGRPVPDLASVEASAGKNRERNPDAENGHLKCVGTRSSTERPNDQVR